jgi:hypothetical protein
LGPYVPVFAPDGTALAYRFDSGLARVLHADGSITKLIDNVSSPTPIAWQPSWVQIDTDSPTTIDYGDTVLLTLRLYWGDQTDNDVVSLYRKTAGPDVLVGQGAVDTDGNLPFVVKPSGKATYVLKWAGDAGHEASTSVFPLLVQVHAEALAVLSHAYGRDEASQGPLVRGGPSGWEAPLAVRRERALLAGEEGDRDRGLPLRPHWEVPRPDVLPRR